MTVFFEEPGIIWIPHEAQRESKTKDQDLLIHKIRWAIYRIGMDAERFNEMIEHVKVQTNNQKARKSMLGIVQKLSKQSSSRTIPVTPQYAS